MGVFTVKVKVRNWQNRFLPADQRGEDLECDALVDSGAIDLCLPAEFVERMRLEPLGTTAVFTADGAQHEYRLVGIVECEVGGRKCYVQAIELPRGAQPLLGAVPMEHMDWHISPLEKRLVPNPKSPDKPLVPLC
jgi:clan AA aspartic protease